VKTGTIIPKIHLTGDIIAQDISGDVVWKIWNIYMSNPSTISKKEFSDLEKRIQRIPKLLFMKLLYKKNIIKSLHKIYI